MSDRRLIGPWIRRFLLEHLIAERNLARNTQASYRDTLTLLLPFLSAAAKTPIDRLTIDDLSPGRLRQFLEHLEHTRGCREGTRNQRLGAVHSLAKFIGMHSPEHLAWCTEVRAVPFKKAAKPAVAYLDKPEIEALLRTPHRRTAQGARDHALLLFLYNSGARVDEAARMTGADLTLGASPAVRLVGKGNKTRSCPLWPVTADALTRLVRARPPQARVFLNRRGQPLTRFGIYQLVRRTAAQARQTSPSLTTKRVSPHTLRHTCAVHLLRAGVDINTIRAWLGHVSLDTTHIYAEIDLEMKAKALARCDVPDEGTVKRWRTEPRLMAFLKAL
ncbi:MAG: tyrosine-type recombinase/integrase [bacterium]